MNSLISITVAAASFVGTHFLFSHPLRRPLVRRVGENTFTGFYSLVALATLGWLGWAFWHGPITAPLWHVGNVLWAIVTLVMLLASVLLMGSLIGNPALPTGGAPAAAPATAKGVFAVTRHPMMWSVALWGLCHIAVYPVAKNIIVAVAMVILALVGAVMQDRKKEQLQAAVWRDWESRTSYWPFLAIATGRARFGGLGLHTLLGGLVVWFVATWVHIPLSGWAAGIWRWLR